MYKAGGQVGVIAGVGAVANHYARKTGGNIGKMLDYSLGAGKKVVRIVDKKTVALDEKVGKMAEKIPGGRRTLAANKKATNTVWGYFGLEPGKQKKSPKKQYRTVTKTTVSTEPFYKKVSNNEQYGKNAGSGLVMGTLGLACAYQGVKRLFR